MGCCVSKDNQGENLISSQRIRDLKQKLLPQYTVASVELMGANNLKKMPIRLFRSQGPYFEFELKPQQSLGEIQKYINLTNY